MKDYERIRYMYLVDGISQRKIARSLGISRNTVAKYCEGKTYPGIRSDYNRANSVMDGKSRWADNIKIERWFRTFKYEEAYLTQYRNIREARKAIRNYINVYNFQRCHSAIGNVPPAERYFPALLLNAAMSAA